MEDLTGMLSLLASTVATCPQVFRQGLDGRVVVEPIETAEDDIGVQVSAAVPGKISEDSLHNLSVQRRADAILRERARLECRPLDQVMVGILGPRKVGVELVSDLITLPDRDHEDSGKFEEKFGGEGDRILSSIFGWKDVGAVEEPNGPRGHVVGLTDGAVDEFFDVEVVVVYRRMCRHG
jgi:hypothetical protein